MPSSQEPAASVTTYIPAPEGLNVDGVKAPKKDTRIKTDDVTATKGLTFQSFGLSEEL